MIELQLNILQNLLARNNSLFLLRKKYANGKLKIRSANVLLLDNIKGKILRKNM